MKTIYRRMFVEFTIYPSRGPCVGYNMWSQEAHPRYLLSSSPFMPIGQFADVVRGTDQNAGFLEQCNALGIDIKLYNHA